VWPKTLQAMVPWWTWTAQMDPHQRLHLHPVCRLLALDLSHPALAPALAPALVPAPALVLRVQTLGGRVQTSWILGGNGGNATFAVLDSSLTFSVLLLMTSTVTVNHTSQF
jgi:hypothetical protein